MAEGRANIRLEAFCDGVFAIAMTLLIIDIKLPAPDDIGNTAELWRALRHMTPSVLAFVLSFVVILITWVNHHAALRLVHKSSASFIYANGFLLLTVVFIPFPTALLGEFVWTDRAGPAVVLYNAVLALQSLSWLLLCNAVIAGRLAASDEGAEKIRANRRSGYGALVLYSALAVAALRVPMAAAVVTAASWMFWLVLGIRMKHA